MPTITYDKKDLLNLIGKKLSNQELEEVISLIKPNVENVKESEITLEMTPDRPDLFGVEGLARAVKQYLGLQSGLKKFSVGSAQLHIKVTHIPNVARGKTLNSRKFLLQILGKPFHHGLPPPLIALPGNNHPSDIPIKTDQFLINRLKSLILS